MKTILIVEDNDKNMKLARDVLQFQGFSVRKRSTAWPASSWRWRTGPTWC